MTEEGNLRVNRKRVVNKHLTCHFGRRVCKSEEDISKIGSNYIEYNIEYEKVDNKKVMYSYRDLSLLMEYHVRDLFITDIHQIEKIEVMLGGDHGKVAFVFLATVIIQYKNDCHDAIIMDLQIGEIDSGTDYMEHLIPLLQ